jgi:hypothetical protein
MLPSPSAQNISTSSSVNSTTANPPILVGLGVGVVDVVRSTVEVSSTVSVEIVAFVVGFMTTIVVESVFVVVWEFVTDIVTVVVEVEFAAAPP